MSDEQTPSAPVLARIPMPVRWRDRVQCFRLNGTLSEFLSGQMQGALAPR